MPDPWLKGPVVSTSGPLSFLTRVFAVMFTWFYTVTKNTSDIDPHSAASIMFQRSCFISMLIYYSG
jgi:hypothetical protein